ncbi:hypothetical protein D3C71_1853580 [compost metagenome]
MHAPAFIGKPFGHRSAGQGFGAGFGQRLALLQRHQLGNRVGALAQQGGGRAHDALALDGRRRAPDLEAFLRRGQGLVQVGNAGMGNLADFLARGGIGHRQRAAIGGVLPLVVDQETGIFVAGTHENPLRWMGR